MKEKPSKTNNMDRRELEDKLTDLISEYIDSQTEPIEEEDLVFAIVDGEREVDVELRFEIL